MRLKTICIAKGMPSCLGANLIYQFKVCTWTICSKLASCV